MEVNFVWHGIPLVHTAIILALVGFFVFSRFYSKDRSKPREKRRQVRANGFYFLILAVVFLVSDIASGISIANPSRWLVVGVATVTLALVYTDGWLTEKAVGNRLATEANPIMGGLFKLVGIRKTRIGILVFVVVCVAYLAFIKDLVTVGLLFLLWIFIDSNNIIVLRGIRRNQALRASVASLEWGFEDMHEL
jgi:hypothetical protein